MGRGSWPSSPRPARHTQARPGGHTQLTCPPGALRAEPGPPPRWMSSTGMRGERPSCGRPLLVVSSWGVSGALTWPRCPESLLRGPGDCPRRVCPGIRTSRPGGAPAGRPVLCAGSCLAINAGSSAGGREWSRDPLDPPPPRVLPWGAEGPHPTGAEAWRLRL